MIALRDPRDLYRYSVVADALPGPDALTDEQVAAYHRDGYVAVENLLTAEEVATGLAALDDLLHGRVADYDGAQPEPEQRERWPQMAPEERAGVVRKLFQFVDHEARLDAMTRHPVLHAILERLIGEPCRLIQDMALLKPPFVGSEKPWHQDMAYFDWSPPEKVIGVWIAFDPATAENGCMHVLPGTHREGPVPHVHARDCQIPDERVQVERDVIVPLAPGGALFFSGLLHHGTPPNDSPLRRRAVQFHYAGRSAVSVDKTQHAALFFENERYAGCRSGNGTPLSELSR